MQRDRQTERQRDREAERQRGRETEILDQANIEQQRRGEKEINRGRRVSTANISSGLAAVLVERLKDYGPEQEARLGPNIWSFHRALQPTKTMLKQSEIIAH